MRVVVALALVAVLVAGCSQITSRFTTTEIGQIQRDTERFQERTVTIRGTVTETLELPILERALYQVQDRTGEIWVQSTAGAPPRGVRVTVTGVVRPKLEINGRNFAVVIIENRREAEP